MIEPIDRYLDAAPRPDAGVIDTGAFTLFVSRTPWRYYARPALGLDRPIQKADLDALAVLCEELGVALEIEWVREARPELEAVAALYGLDLRTHSLLSAAAERVHAAEVDGVTIRVVSSSEDPALVAGRAVADVSFGFGGTATGNPGAAERNAAELLLSPELVAHLRYRAASGLTVTAVAEAALAGVVAVGAYQPVGDAAELVAIATLPCARRRGVAGALTARLARHALDHGVSTLLLSAQDDDVARIYQRAGFARVGVAVAAHADRRMPELAEA